ncbi:MAG: T9SS type A sorting domain-containing protein [Bacteroidota bacterium]|nr:T9SS type A sorting domain-containing protein [Bacteroidota bacterium]
MKKNYKFILSFLLSVSTLILLAQAPVPDLLHYKFNGTGTLVTNYASAPPVGTATGTLVGAQTQTGTIGCIGAGVGTGASSTTDYLNTGWITNFPSTGWTISFWSDNIQPSATLYYIFGDVNAGGFRCFTNGVAGAGNWILRGTGITDVLMTGAATTTANMVTFVYDQTLSNIVGYINGVSTVTVAQGVPTITSSTGPFKILSYGSSTGLSAGGLMGDYRIYSTALTSTAVLAIYNETTATPTVLVSGSNSVCLNQSVTLTASGASSYTWNTASTNSSIAVSPTITTSYTVTGGVGTCTNSAITSVTVNSLPSILVNSGAICAGNSFTMNPSGASTYTFSNGNAIVTPTANSSYSVTGTDANGCVSSNPAVSSVTVNPSPTVTAVSSTSILCVGQTASLTASGATTYTWNTTSNNTVIAISPTVTTTYTVTGEANSCTNTFTISQTVSACTGIDNKVTSSLGVLVYPNPNSGLFSIELNNGSIKNIEVMDVTGRIVLAKTSSNEKIDFNINTLSNGIYYVKIQSNNSVEVVKVVKQ